MFVGGVGATVAQVFTDGVVDEVRLLRHDADDLAERFQFDVLDVRAVDRDRARVGVVEARNQVGKRRFSRTGWVRQGR